MNENQNDKFEQYQNRIDIKNKKINKLKESNYSLKWLLGFATFAILMVAANGVKKKEDIIKQNKKQKIEIEQLRNKIDSLQIAQYKIKGK